MNVIKQARFIPKEEIEAKAIKVLRFVQTQRKRSLKWPIDPGHIAEYLGLDMDCGYISPDDDGEIAAMIIPTERKIIMNERSLELPPGFEESSIAHEIGHWELHIDKYAISNLQKQGNSQLEASVEPFLCRSSYTQNKIEWQAQYFASCFLMPKFKLQEVLRGRYLTNWKHLYAMKDEFGVTISNLTNRLQGLGWIDIPKGSKQIYLGNNFPR